MKICYTQAAIILFFAMSSSQGQDIAGKVERIDSLLTAIKAEIADIKLMLGTDTSGVLTAASQAAGDKGVRDTGVEQEPAAALLIPSRGKKLLATDAKQYLRTAIGFMPSTYFDQQFTDEFFVYFCMTGLHWFSKWGIKGSAGFLRESGVDWSMVVYVSCLRSIHRFTFRDREFFRLYALGGVGGFWKEYNYIPYGTIDPVSPRGYSRPDFVFGGMTALAVDITVIGGLKLSPEIGFKGNYRVNRYEDLPEWKESNDTISGWSERSAGNSYLGFYFSMNLFLFIL
jgi:hypothetical protein